MNRIDSVAGSYLPKIPSQEPLCNNNTIRHSKHHKNKVESIPSFQVADMEPRRPVSEQRSRPLRQQSTTSSENSNNRSKSRGHGSKPSSRRTSCTIVDPSRPARHYRVKSFQTPPATTTSQDVDDVLALHFRSCSIFSNPSYQSNSGLPSPSLSQGDAFGFPSAATRFSSDSLRVVEETSMHRQSEDTIDAEKTNTTMHWTSPCTRKREYERIDKANSGLRGFFRKVTPRCVSGTHEKFYEKDQSDAGSVRRYRMDDLDDAHINEKHSTRPRTSPTPRPNSRPGMKKRWTCF
ncbi:hypothetical protein BKA58DRAFT_235355 [Alternaria rosae]|uniref:uncharacterized protein n=1 Tax=Alternaria rosae TaxID=1187941 RepID=UPI001E8E887D|nr:uncharacterized protein BKA58DRAFT_235355 [Alternaria rosae]KAH6864927.1 hypothetical protein BKA58DRAFT_235355 [Alternaria rosae]